MKFEYVSSASYLTFVIDHKFLLAVLALVEWYQSVMY